MKLVNGFLDVIGVMYGLSREEAKEATVIAALAVGGVLGMSIGCGNERPSRIADQATGSMYTAVRWNAGHFTDATEELIFGDFPPHGSIDYVVRVTRDSTQKPWEVGKLVLPGQEGFEQYCALLKESRK